VPTPRTLLGTLCFLLLLTFAHSAAAQAEVQAVAGENGRCQLTLPTQDPGTQFYLIVGTLGPAEESVRVRLRTETAVGPEEVPLARPTLNVARQETLRQQALQQERGRQHAPVGHVPAVPPPESRVFHLFITDKDLGNAGQYAAVDGELSRVGRHCQVYVDRADGGSRARALQPTVADIVRTFDEEVYPWASQHLGQARDVDRDGRFTILLSPWLSKLQSGKVALDGFVRGSDFHLDLHSPFSNHCDMLYLNSRLSPGPYLRTLLVHEYTHAVVFCEHVFGRYLATAAPRDEEDWLNEGLAHVVESLHRLSWENLDYRISAYLTCPQRYPLVVPDYYQAGLWRTAGTRGSAYLFLRWCCDQHGPGLLRRLAQSSLHGIDNLETATQTPFAELFRSWAVAQLRQPTMGNLPRLCPGPRCQELPLGGAARDEQLVGTALLYLHLHSPTAPFTRVCLESTGDRPLQVTLVRVPADQPRLSLRCDEVEAPDRVQLHVTAQGGPVHLEAACWERLAQAAARTEDTSYDPSAPQREIATWFHAPELAADEKRVSAVLTLPAALRQAAVIFKVVGRDHMGRPVAAYATRAGCCSAK
jgi:hypothetical protein